MKFCLCGCGQELTGKQQKFASDACRMRYNREKRTKANESEQACSLFKFRQTKVELDIVVIFGVDWGQDFDGILINKPVRMQLAQFLRSFLARQHPDTQVLSVRVERKPDKW